jgi:hypothetical protein
MRPIRLGLEAGNEAITSTPAYYQIGVHHLNRAIDTVHRYLLVKGIVSPDWKGLQMVSLDRFEV